MADRMNSTDRHLIVAGISFGFLALLIGINNFTLTDNSSTFTRLLLPLGVIAVALSCGAVSLQGFCDENEADDASALLNAAEPAAGPGAGV